MSAKSLIEHVQGLSFTTDREWLQDILSYDAMMKRRSDFYRRKDRDESRWAHRQTEIAGGVLFWLQTKSWPMPGGRDTEAAIRHITSKLAPE